VIKGKERIMGHVVLTGIIEREEDQFVSYCPELGVASCGDTVDEAIDNLGDAIQVQLDALEETGELRRVFHERNIRIDLSPPPFDGVSIKVPPGKICYTYPRQVPLAGAA
jgi:predicted RNase H-like HicB family nuclease